MVAGKQGFFFTQRIAHMIGHVAGGEHALEGPIITGNDIAMGDNMVGTEIIIGVFFKSWPVKLVGAGGSVAVNFRARALL